MFRNKPRAALVLLALALTASACVDNQDPTQPDRATSTKPQFAFGDIITVTNTNDNGLGSLRWAMAQATNGEFIEFDPSLAGQTIVVDSPLVHNGGIQIKGPAGKGITISGGGKTRIFEIGALNTLFYNLTLTGGNSGAQPGGAITSQQSLGFYNTTFTGNTGNGGAAIAGYNVLLMNSTASGNTSTDGGPAVYAASHLNLVYSTVAFNTGQGAGAQVIHLGNAILSDNTNENCISTVLTTYDASVVSDDDTCGGPLQAIIANPLLGPLADNGGPSRTHALLAGSPAINAGTKCNFAMGYEKDQRTVPRDSACDIGAYEFTDPTTIALVVDAGPSINPITMAVFLTGTVKCSRNETFDVAVDLKQDTKKKSVTATGTVAVACKTTAQPWSVALAPDSGAFAVGSGVASAKSANTAGWVTPASTSLPVRIFMGHR